MRKRIAFLSFAAAIAFCYSCSNDETVAVNDNAASNEISFRPLMNSATRATATTLTTLQSATSFFAEAWTVAATPASYISATQFAYDSESTHYYAADNTKYYWPPTGNLNFIAWFPNIGSQLTHPAWNTFQLVPGDAVTSHVDYVIAATLNRSKAASATGVPLAFKHLGSWIELKVYNGKGTASDNIKITVSGWKIAYLHKGGLYTITPSTGSTVDGSALSTTGTYSYPSPYDALVTANVPNSYSETISEVENYITLPADGTRNESSEAVSVGNAMIIVPQATTQLTTDELKKYGTGGYINGTYIAVKMTITNAAGTLTHADATGDEMWAVWPIANDWTDGTKYIYTIDLSQGGYKEKGTATNAFDKWFEGSEIFFSNVTVTGWTDPATPGSVSF